MLAKRLFGFAIFLNMSHCPKFALHFSPSDRRKCSGSNNIQETALCCIQIAPFLSRSLPPLQLFQAIITPARPAQLEVPSGAKKRDRGRAHASSLSPRLAIEPAAEAFLRNKAAIKASEGKLEVEGKERAHETKSLLPRALFSFLVASNFRVVHVKEKLRVGISQSYEYSWVAVS